MTDRERILAILHKEYEHWRNNEPTSERQDLIVAGALGATANILARFLLESPEPEVDSQVTTPEAH